MSLLADKSTQSNVLGASGTPASCGSLLFVLIDLVLFCDNHFRRSGLRLSHLVLHLKETKIVFTIAGLSCCSLNLISDLHNIYTRGHCTHNECCMPQLVNRVAH